MLLRETSNSDRLKTKDSRIGRPPPRATIMCPCSVLKAFRTNQCKSLNFHSWNMTLKKYEKSFKKNLVFHWRVHPNLMKKASKMAIFKELLGTLSFFWPEKNRVHPPFGAWDFMSGIRTFRASGTKTTGWHPLLSHWDGHRLRLRSLFNSGSPKFHASKGGETCFSKRKICGKQQPNTQCSKRRLPDFGSRVRELTVRGWSEALPIINWSWLYLQEWIFLPTRPRWRCPPWCLLTMGRCTYEYFTAKRPGGYRVFLDEIGFFQTSMRNSSQEFWGHLGFATIYRTCLDVSHQAVRAAWHRQQNIHGIIDIFQTWTHKFSKVFHFKKFLSPSIQWRVWLSGKDKNNQKHINSFFI